MAAAVESSLVLVTGASGFIATHIIQQLQEDGYRVRGTVRSLQDENKVKHLHELCPNTQFKLELVEADLGKPESWETAVKDVEYVIHVASPLPAQAAKEDSEVVQPAVEGTQSILKACVAAKTIKRIVLTSSCAAIAWGSVTSTGDKVFSEEDWSDPEKIDAYAKSKTMAEKVAWDFIKELPDEDRIELAVVNPAYVLGPVLHGTQCTSMELIKRLLERSMPAVPKINFPIVDVRDVAAAHIKAMTVPEAAGHRHLVVNTNLWMKEMAQILSKEFKPQGYNVPTLNCPFFALWMTSLFDKTIKLILPEVNKVRKFDNTRMKDVLGVTPREAKDTLIDMAYSLIESGFVKRSKKFRGPGWQEEDAAKAREEEEKKQREKEEKEKEKESTKPADSEMAAENQAETTNVKENGDVAENKPAEVEEKKEGEHEKKEEAPAELQEQQNVPEGSEAKKEEPETKTEEPKDEEKAEEK